VPRANDFECSQERIWRLVREFYVSKCGTALRKCLPFVQECMKFSGSKSSLRKVLKYLEHKYNSINS
jgi:hypothetical protein